MTSARAGFVLALALFAAPAVAAPPTAPAGLKITWHPARVRIGDVAWMYVQGVREGAVLEGAVGGRPLIFFPYAGGQAALVGFDVDTKVGEQIWRLAVISPGDPPHMAQGRVRVDRREFAIQRLSLPSRMVDLDPETERRATAEADHLKTVYRTITPVRLWHGRFTRPVGGMEPGTGFGSRRVINGQPRAPHTGVDFAAPEGTPVVAVNDGRVAAVAEYFFPGRLVLIDHGLGLYTLYFHLRDALVTDGDRVTRGQSIGTVGATGRATGPHLHFGAQIGAARIDPASLFELTISD